MSKWTFEKINQCEEITPGTKFDIIYEEGNTFSTAVLLNKTDEGITFDTKGSPSPESIKKYYRMSAYLTYKFYKDDGNEILPPEDKKNLNE